MIIQPVHILNQMGIITSFSVAKKVSENDINKFYARQKKAGKKDTEIEKILREKILSDIQDAVISSKIPGLLTQKEVAEEMGISKSIIENIPELNRIIMVISHKLSEKKYNKMSLCYFINSLVNILGLGEKDFEKFHQQNNDGNENNEENDSDDNDDGEDDGYKNA